MPEHQPVSGETQRQFIRSLQLQHRVVFSAIGEPAYSDVPKATLGLDTYEATEQAALRMLADGNWKSFVIEKRYVRLVAGRDEGTDE